MVHGRRHLESPRARRTRWPVVVALAVCVLALVRPLWAQPAADLRQFSVALESLSDQVRPAVVQTFATGFTPGEGVVRQVGRAGGLLFVTLTLE
ncbi:MAG: hypothetical protein ABGY72_22125 [bacterium]